MPRGSLATSARRRPRAPGRVSARAHDPGMRADKARYVSEMFTCIAGQYGLMTFGMHHGWRRARRSPSPRARCSTGRPRDRARDHGSPSRSSPRSSTSAPRVARDARPRAARDHPDLRPDSHGAAHVDLRPLAVELRLGQ